jgi:hypothetical protein
MSFVEEEVISIVTSKTAAAMDSRMEMKVMQRRTVDRPACHWFNWEGLRGDSRHPES